MTGEVMSVEVFNLEIDSPGSSTAVKQGCLFFCVTENRWVRILTHLLRSKQKAAEEKEEQRRFP